MSNPWISCKDRLPEFGSGLVLAYWDDGDMVVSSANKLAGGHRTYITHWMPLPEPPISGPPTPEPESSEVVPGNKGRKATHGVDRPEPRGAIDECERLGYHVCGPSDPTGVDRLYAALGAISDLMYVGNRLARGEATAEEWHDAVARAIPDHAKPTVCRRTKRTGS